MGFFDLCIPYLESEKHITDNARAARKTTRLKLIVKAMELGYSGVAYNRTIKGLMSDSDRCSISLFPLSSLLKLAPSLSISVKLHRDLLNVPISSPFRQYTRLTVIVDSPAQAAALNSGNPILKSYNIVAVRPLNQSAFEQACQASEVDLISIDFSEKLPFRLKQTMVKAAIGRNVYFEVMYSGLLMDSQIRRQMLSNAKLLVDWTRGQNLIFSSAAPSVTGLRGPNDVANLSSLLGLPMERAKAAISKNCRSLLANALRKKQYYKGTIRVDLISSGEQVEPKELFPCDWIKWDPISSGEGDLQLEDMAKSFGASEKVSKTVKAIDFTSVMDSLPSHSLQVTDFVSLTKAPSEPLVIGKSLFSNGETEVAVATNEESQQKDRLGVPFRSDRTSFCDTAKHRISFCEDSGKTFSPPDIVNDFTHASTVVTDIFTNENESSNGLEAHFTTSVSEMHDFQSKNCKDSCETHINAVATTEIPTLCEDIHFSTFQSEESVPLDDLDAALAEQSVAMDRIKFETAMDCDKYLHSASCNVSLHEGSFEGELSSEARDDLVTLSDGLLPKRDDEINVNKEKLNTNNEPVGTHGDSVAIANALPVPKLADGLPVPKCDDEMTVNNEKSNKNNEPVGTQSDSVTTADALPVPKLYDEMHVNGDYSATNDESVGEVVMEDQKQTDHMETRHFDESVSGKRRVRRRMAHGPFLFPFKRLLNPVYFRKKPRKLETGLKCFYM